MGENAIAAFYEDYSIYFFGIIVGAAIFAAVIFAMALRRIQRENVNHVLYAAVVAIPAGVIGAKAFYCWHGPDGEIKISSLFSLSKYLSGGMGLYGALGAGLLAVLIVCLIFRIDLKKLLDCIAPALAFGIGIGRFAAKYTTTDRGNVVKSPAFQRAPFATWNSAEGEWMLNVYFFEALVALVICVMLTAMFLNRYGENGAKREFKPGDVTLAFMFLYGLMQCWMEPLRTDALYWKSNILSKLHFVLISQAMSALIAAIALAIFIIRYTYRNGITIFSVFTVVLSAMCFVCLFADELRISGSTESFSISMSFESAMLLIGMGLWLMNKLGEPMEGEPKAKWLSVSYWLNRNKPAFKIDAE